MRRDTHLYWERKPVEVLIQAHISDAVGDWLAGQGLSQIVASELMGIGQPQFGNRLNNRTRWSVEDVYQVCRVLNIPLEVVLPSLDEVFGGDV